MGMKKTERGCVIIANLLRCYRIRAWSCTSLGVENFGGALKDNPLFSVEVYAVCCIFRKVGASGTAAPAAIFAGVQPSRLILIELPLTGGVAPGYSKYSLPGWIVLLAVNLDTLKCRRRRIVDL